MVRGLNFNGAPCMTSVRVGTGVDSVAVSHVADSGVWVLATVVVSCLPLPLTAGGDVEGSTHGAGGAVVIVPEVL